jgi:thiamine-monophosphate kinase
VYRNTAQPGDLLCVSGDLGGAFIGIQILEREKALFLDNPGIKPDLADYAYVVGRQLKPEPRADVIKMLKSAGIKPTAMIDISDGLASEVFHICRQSRVGAVIKEASTHPFYDGRLGCKV